MAAAEDDDYIVAIDLATGRTHFPPEPTMWFRLKRYGWHLLVAVDQLLNALLGGWPDETLSSRAAKAQMAGRRWGCIFCKVLDVIDRGHCRKYVEWDEGNA